MTELLAYSLFQDVLFPQDTDLNQDSSQGDGEELRLQKVIRFTLENNVDLANLPIVVFDFETTGLDSREDEIIELGAQKLVDFSSTDEFHSLIKPGIALPDLVTKITGITQDMLDDKPSIDQILPDFLEFIEGSLLVAHNAEFDMGFLRAACKRMGYQLDWPCICTLKMTRVLLPDLESRNLDKLAEHFGLQFDARHRAIGDVKVTGQVLMKTLEGQTNASYKTWQELQVFSVSKE